MIVFIHIPKTSGTSFRRFLHQIDTVKRTNIHEIYTIDHSIYPIISGHIYYRHAKDLFPEAQFITLLREPVARAVSHFKHIKKDKNHYLHTTCKNMSLSEFLYNDELVPTISNLQTKYLMYKSSIYNLQEIELAPVAASANAALNNLEEFYYIGFQDNHIAAVQSLFRKLKLQPPEVNQKKIEKYRRTTSKKLIRRLEDLNLEDIKLYNEAKRLYG